MTDDEFRMKLPVLARKGFDNMLPNQYVAFSPEILSSLARHSLMNAALTLTMQLKPDQRIQYVTLEELEFREVFLEIGLIKETKKAGGDRYVVPKSSAFCGIDG